MSGPLMAVAAACGFGVAEFIGGIASKRTSTIKVALVAQLSGLAVLFPGLLVFGGTPSLRALVGGALAGLAGALGTIVFLRALAQGPMGVVSALAAAIGAILPIGVGLFLGERLAAGAIAGVVLGLVAVALTTATGTTTGRLMDRGPALAFFAGLMFAAFIIAISLCPPESGLWPLVGARAVSLPVIGGLLLLRRPATKRPPTPYYAALVGIIDMMATMFFLAAIRATLLSVATLITALAPVIVVVLAWRFLAERLTARQAIGSFMAVVAVALIAAST